MDKTAKLELAQTIIGYRFEQIDLLWEALQAAGSGVPFLNGHYLHEGNKSMAIVGDKLLGLHLAKIGRTRDERIGTINDRISTHANNARLQAVCDSSGLTRAIQNNPSQGIQVQPKIKSTTVEAVIAAAYYDGKTDAVQTVIDNLGII